MTVKSSVLFPLIPFLICGVVEADETVADKLKFFETNIHPVLEESCFSCHSQKSEKLKGDLLLDSRDSMLRGGKSGPAVVPGDPEKSLLIQAIRYEDADSGMPPKHKGEGGKLPELVIANFVKWVSDGVFDPREGTVKTTGNSWNLEKAKEWWAFQPVKKPAIPSPSDQQWSLKDIDRLVLSALEHKKLRPVKDADKVTLLRRVAFDLTGLPPSPQVIESFTDDSGPNHKTFEQVVDEFLASPRFGERWGRHWLDVARYAESTGRDMNYVQPEAWRYRDYVVDSFDQDKPFDRFIREQLAGDLLPDKSDEERATHLIATGFLALGPKSMNEVDARQFAVDLADEQIDTTSQAFLGLTVACARCHDHKFDPISQRDYTALAGIFLSTETRYGTPGRNKATEHFALIALPPTLKVPMASRRMDPQTFRQKSTRLSMMTRQLEAEFMARKSRQGSMSERELVITATISAQLRAELAAYNADGSLKPLIMAVLDKPVSTAGTFAPPNGGFDTICDSPFFVRGSILKPADSVPRALPAFISRDASIKVPASTSGRLELANWIASPTNTLTARVMANRVWFWLFGRGLVTTLDNFGNTGAQPSNPELLDYLATRFVELGWSVKKLIREIVLSRAYQLSTQHDEANFAVDPDNAFGWRMNQRRLDAESIRDGMLAASGKLDLTRQTGSLLSSVGDGPVGGQRKNRVIMEEEIVKANGTFRSLYLPIARGVTAETLAIFDFADPVAVMGARDTTIVPPQALYLMNSEFVEQQSIAFAKRILESIPMASTKEKSGFEQQFRLACLLAWSRAPFPDEVESARKFVEDQSSSNSDMTAIWMRVCRALLGSAEFRYLN